MFEKYLIGFFAVVSFLGFSALPAFAWEDCPSGLTNDPYPGECSRYIDTDNNGICDHSEPAPENRTTSITSTTSPVSTSSTENNTNQEKKPEKDYYFGPISIVLLLIYILSFTISRFKFISTLLHRKIWNVFLLLTFLVSGILGTFLVIRITWGSTFINFPFNILFWHVEAGIAMTLISIFHILWHWPYFKNLVKIKK